MKKEELLHERILKAIVTNWPEKPEPVSADDILWKISDPSLEAWRIKEVLEWLTANKEMDLVYGKYLLKPHRFIEIRNELQKKNVLTLVQPTTEKQSKQRKTYGTKNEQSSPIVNFFQINQPQDSSVKIKKIIIASSVLIILFSKIFFDWKSYTNHIATLNPIIENIEPAKIGEPLNQSLSPIKDVNTSQLRKLMDTHQSYINNINDEFSTLKNTASQNNEKLNQNIEKIKNYETDAFFRLLIFEIVVALLFLFVLFF